MAYTAPRTWEVDEVVTATMLNTHIRDNMNALKAPPSDNYEANEGSNYTTTSGTFADVDATGFSLTITTTGGDVMVGFVGGLKCSAGAVAHLNVDMDGSPVVADDGIIGADVGNTILPASLAFVYLITSVSAGSHTFKLQWKVNSGTLTMYAGAGTSNADIHPQFWAREVS